MDFFEHLLGIDLHDNGLYEFLFLVIPAVLGGLWWVRKRNGA